MQKLVGTPRSSLHFYSGDLERRSWRLGLAHTDGKAQRQKADGAREEEEDPERQAQVAGRWQLEPGATQVGGRWQAWGDEKEPLNAEGTGRTTLSDSVHLTERKPKSCGSGCTSWRRRSLTCRTRSPDRNTRFLRLFALLHTWDFYGISLIYLHSC